MPLFPPRTVTFANDNDPDEFGHVVPASVAARSVDSPLSKKMKARKPKLPGRKKFRISCCRNAFTVVVTKMMLLRMMMQMIYPRGLQILAITIKGDREGKGARPNAKMQQKKLMAMPLSPTNARQKDALHILNACQQTL